MVNSTCEFISNNNNGSRVIDQPDKTGIAPMPPAVVVNKFTRTVYHAKALISIFGNYFGTTDEEETDQSSNQNAVTDSVLRKSPVKVVLVNKKQNSKKFPHLQTKKIQRKN